MKNMRFVLTLIMAGLIVITAACAPAATNTPEATTAPDVSQPTTAPVVEQPTSAPATGKVHLIVLTHWGEESVMTPMQAKLDEYMKLNPNVEIEYQAVTFDQLLTKITTARAAGISPDIYHFYNLWTPDFVKGGMLAIPPQDVLDDITASYAPGSVGAVTYQNQVWGYPTEVNTYQLVYNKKMFADAGLKPPTTFQELKDAACKLAQVGTDGAMTRSGLALMTGWDSGVVHPFLSLLWSAGGQYIADDFSKSLFNSPEGLATLKLYTGMISEKCIDPSIGAYTDFVTGKAAMVIMANWFRAELQSSFVDGYENVGVLPIPTDGGNKSIALQYNWLWGVDAGSKNAAEAWKFLKWMNSPAAEGQASPMGDYLTSALGAIPSRASDQAALADRLSDEFMKAYVASTATSKAEPIFAGGQEVKTALQTEIEAAWYGSKTPEDALKFAAEEADRILTENK